MSHTAELIAVGTELLLGNIANTNAQFLSAELSTLGINVFYHTVVGDNPQRLIEAVNIAKKRADIIITTGGLGPTCDDLTKNGLAEAFGKKLVFDKPWAAHLERYFAELGRTLTENNYQQAWVPEGCTVLFNDFGTAPGVAFEAEGVLVCMLPGPPRECKGLFTAKVRPLLQARADGVIVSRTLRVYGIGESAAETLLRDKMNALTNPTLAPYAKEGEVELRITAKARSAAEARALIAPVEEEVRAILGDKIYGADVSSLEAVCLELLTQGGLTVGTAESVSGGLVAKRLSDLPGASKVLKGGVVSYTNEVKRDVLGVPAALLDNPGEVSEAVAKAMAEGARKLLRCDLAVSTTGVAGPGPDEKGNPAGLVYAGIATAKGTTVKTLQAGYLAREQVRNAAAKLALDLIRRELTGRFAPNE
jgi:nicotinamide-nucleotide amidase